MSGAKMIWLCVFVSLASACSREHEHELLPEIAFVADFGTPENADAQIRDLAARTELELRDTMVGLDGFENYLLGKDGAVVLITPRFECARPDNATYLVEVSVTPELPSDELPTATSELIRGHFSTSIRSEEGLPTCPE